MEFTNTCKTLKELCITCIIHETRVDDVKEVVEKEINGPGKLLGYQEINKNLRVEYSIHIPCHLMLGVKPEGIAAGHGDKKIKKKKQRFNSERPM